MGRDSNRDPPPYNFIMFIAHEKRRNKAYDMRSASAILLYSFYLEPLLQLERGMEGSPRKGKELYGNGIEKKKKRKGREGKGMTW